MTNDAEILWPLVHNILAAQRGRPHPRLDALLREDPTRGLPSDVRRALLTVAAAHDDRVTPNLIWRQIDAEGDERTFTACEWPVLPPLEPDPYPETRGRRTVTHNDLDQFFKQHHLQPPLEGDDEHIAEREFVVHVIAPVLGWEGLKRLTPQEIFVDGEGKQRRIDFVLRGERSYALEVEGATYHAIDHHTEASFDDETRRRRALAEHGYEYRPFTYGEIRSGVARRYFRRLCASDARLSGFVSAAPGQSAMDAGDNATMTPKLLVWATERFVQVQRALVPLLAHWVAQGNQTITVLNADVEVGVLNLALSELLTCASFTAELFGLDVRLPRVTIHSEVAGEAEHSMLAEILTTYLGGSTSEDKRLDRAANGSVQHVVLADPADYASGAYDAVFGVEAPAAPAPATGSIPYYSLVGMPRAPSLPISVPELLRRFEDYQPPKRVFDYFARRLFQIPSLRDEQYRIICQLLSGGSQLAILPTAFGKSLCYQLSAVLIPGTIFVVSPLRALMRDQMHGLEIRGLTCAEAIMFEDSRSEKDRKMGWLAEGRFRVFYLAPERVQIKTFVDELARCVAAANVWALAVDEAHCVSEWGHDFRVAYLQLGRFRRTLSEHHSQVPVLALTATASDWVATDVCHILGIRQEDIMRHASVDRKEISLSVHALQESQQKAKQLASLLTNTIPTALGQPLILSKRDDAPASTTPAATVIFSPYADARGKATANLNLSTIATTLISDGIVRPDQVRVYASKQPKVCPHCGSGDCVFEQPGGYRCRACGMASGDLKPLVGERGAYSAVVRQIQEDFARSQFPIMVATKAFGMGIDKRNIRAIVHYAFADGLEAYVQELGRAGRDQRHAHAALLFTAPERRCAQILRGSKTTRTREDYGLFRPECVSDPMNFKRWRCPYGLTTMCDYGLKARHIEDDYASIEDDVLRSLAVFAHLAHAKTLRTSMLGAHINPAREKLFPGSKETLSLVQFALYRLQQVGFVETWSVDYGSDFGDPPVSVEVHAGWTLDYGVEATGEALRKLILSATGADTFADALRPIRDSLADGDTRLQIEGLLTQLITLTHRAIKAMRYNMLWSEWQYAEAEDGTTCRRGYLRRIFDSKSVSSEQQSCGSCDICCPDLQFDAERITVSVTNAKLDALAKQLPHLLASFEPDAMRDAIETASEHHALLGLQGQAEQRLVVEPANSAARALAGLCAQARGLINTALLHFSAGLLSVETNSRDLHRAMYFYEQARSIDAERALDLIDKHGGMFDTPHGHSLLLHELQDAAENGIIDQERVTMMRTTIVHDAWQASFTPALESVTRQVSRVEEIERKGAEYDG